MSSSTNDDEVRFAVEIEARAVFTFQSTVYMTQSEFDEAKAVEGEPSGSQEAKAVAENWIDHSRDAFDDDDWEIINVFKEQS